MFDKSHYEEVMVDWPSYDTRRIANDGDTPGKRAEYRLNIIAGFNVSDSLKKELYEDYLFQLVSALRVHDGAMICRKFTVPESLDKRSPKWLTTATV